MTVEEKHHGVQSKTNTTNNVAVPTTQELERRLAELISLVAVNPYAAKRGDELVTLFKTCVVRWVEEHGRSKTSTPSVLTNTANAG